MSNSKASLDAAQAVLDLAKRRLAEDSEQGRILLQTVITAFPTTDSAKEAAELLRVSGPN